MKTLRYGLLALAALTSLAFLYVLEPASLAATIFLGVWLVLPYALLGFVLLFRARERSAIIADTIVSLAVSAGGLLFLTYVIFVNPDPQGAIAVLLSPVYQLLAMAVLLPLSRLWRPKKA